MDRLGKEASDKVTGFTGVVTGIYFRLYGSAEVLVTAADDGGDGKVMEHWFPTERLAFLKVTGGSGGHPHPHVQG